VRKNENWKTHRILGSQFILQRGDSRQCQLKLFIKRLQLWDMFQCSLLRDALQVIELLLTFVQFSGTTHGEQT
jgi:hypothetical protein